MPTERICEVCGAQLPPNPRGEPCPACLVRLALRQEAAEAQPTSRVTAPIEQGPGTRMIGRYKLLEKIGEGGFGTVYVAEQREPVKRRVALKIIKLGMDTKQVIARFEAERQALAMMDHPNIAKVLDAGATDTGRPYFVMELVRGIKITEYCDENNLPTGTRLDLFISVCQAIQHAHQKGIIHRDIKPSNILVTLHDGVPVPKVIDFGIAKATQGELTDKTVYTQLQEFIGTPAYMSPEQAEMSGLDIDTRADIYSLGVLLYELLTGKTPFDGQELLASGVEQMRRTIREKEPLKPSTRLSQQLVGADVKRVASKAEEEIRASSRRLLHLKKLIELLRGDLDCIVMKCLEKDRTRRYETANGLATDVQRYLNTEPVAARPPSQLYRFQKLVRRNKLAVTAAAVVLAALVLGVVVSTWQAIRANHFREQAQGQARRAEAEAKRAEAEAQANRQNLYAADMNLASHALEDFSLVRARELLQKHVPNLRIASSNDLRGWEWRYLRGQCRSDDISILGRYDKQVSSVRVSPDGRLLAAACDDGKVRLWDFKTREPLPELETFSGTWNSRAPPQLSHVLAFSPDSRKLAAGGMSAEIKIWDVASRQPRLLCGLPGHTKCVTYLAFSGKPVFRRTGKWFLLRALAKPDFTGFLLCNS